MDLRLTVAGLLVGTIAGMTGIGGGSLLAPILILFFGVKASIAVGTDLLYSVPMKALAAYAHIRQGTVDLRIVKLLSLGGIPGALVGLAVFAYIRAHVGAADLEHLLRHAIGIVILCAATATLVLTLAARLRPRTASAAHPGATVAIGAAVGFLVALTSIGSGSITLPLLILALPAIRLRALIGSEIVFAALMIPVAAAGHVAFANVDWTMALSLTAGALPGAYLGARLCARIGEQSLRPVVICVLAFAGFKLL
jgi:uncharacterized membrane protein YfcA